MKDWLRDFGSGVCLVLASAVIVFILMLVVLGARVATDRAIAACSCPKAESLTTNKGE